MRFSLWNILKDNIGKDITKVSTPVTFNDPLSITQKSCMFVEYVDILEEAMKLKGEGNASKRLAYVSVFAISIMNYMERNQSKPFNPI